jgi:hypothetical protein
MCPNHSPFRSHCLIPSLFFSLIPLVSLSRTTLADHLDTTTWQPYALFYILFSFPFMHLHLLYSVTIAGTPEVAVTIQTSTSRRGSPHVYKTVLLRVEDDNPPVNTSLSLVQSSSFLSLFSSISTHQCALSVSVIIQWNCCPHDRCRSLALVLSQSTHTHTHTHTPSFLPLILGQHFHPRSTYLRYTTN